MENKPLKSGIYCWRNSVNGKVYVGSSSNMANRKHSHRYDLRKNQHGNPHLQNAWNYYGEAAFVFEILEFVEEPNLLEREAHYFSLLGALDRAKGYNIRQDPEKRIFTEETRRKISAAKRGTKLSEEQKEQIRMFHTGKKRSQETKDKISVALTGREFSESHKLQISKSKTGQKTCDAECRRKQSDRMKKLWAKHRDSGFTGFGLPRKSIAD